MVSLHPSFRIVCVLLKLQQVFIYLDVIQSNGSSGGRRTHFQPECITIELSFLAFKWLLFSSNYGVAGGLPAQQAQLLKSMNVPSPIYTSAVSIVSVT